MLNRNGEKLSLCLVKCSSQILQKPQSSAKFEAVGWQISSSIFLPFLKSGYSMVRYSIHTSNRKFLFIVLVVVTQHKYLPKWGYFRNIWIRCHYLINTRYQPKHLDIELNVLCCYIYLYLVHSDSKKNLVVDLVSLV